LLLHRNQIATNGFNQNDLTNINLIVIKNGQRNFDQSSSTAFCDFENQTERINFRKQTGI
jgi:hypothetical protein